MLDRIEILVSDIPRCSGCGRLMAWLRFEEIPDGVTTILTRFAWYCPGCGQGAPANLPDVYVDAHRPTEEQISVQVLSTERSPN